MKPVYLMIGPALLGACLSARAQDENKPEQARPALAKEAPPPVTAPPVADRSDDTRAIGALVEAFTKAYDAGDAAAIAATFTAGALVVDEEGEHTLGRAAIHMTV